MKKAPRLIPYALLDAQGSPIIPAVLKRAQAMRINQYLLDRMEALASPYDRKRWLALQLRWAMDCPQQGYDDEEVVEFMWHVQRLVEPRVGPDAKLESAIWLQANEYQLPPSMSIVNGVLHGATYIDPTTQGGTA